MARIMATDSTEQHGKNQHSLAIFPRPSVDSVAMNNNTDTQLEAYQARAVPPSPA